MRRSYFSVEQGRCHPKLVGALAARALAGAGVLAKDTRDTVLRRMPPLAIERREPNEALDLAIPVRRRRGRIADIFLWASDFS